MMTALPAQQVAYARTSCRKNTRYAIAKIATGAEHTP